MAEFAPTLPTALAVRSHEVRLPRNMTAPLPEHVIAASEEMREIVAVVTPVQREIPPLAPDFSAG